MNRRGRKRPLQSNQLDFPLRRSKRLRELPSNTIFEDMNDDCLGLIFEHLDIESLYFIATVNERFLNIARNAFARLFRKNTAFRIKTYRGFIGCPFYVDEDEDGDKDEYDNDARGDDKDNVINVPRNLEQFLNCFGYLIRCIHIDYRIVEISMDELQVLENLILDKCADTLQKLKVYSDFDDRHLVLATVNRPLHRVTSASFENVKFPSELSHIHTWLPNIEKLAISNCVIDNSTVQINGKHLTKLIDLYVMTQTNDGFKRLDFENMITSNPQLKSLDIHAESGGDDDKTIDWSFFHHIASKLPDLEKLSIAMSIFGSISNVEPILFENVKEFTLSRCRYSDAWMAPNIHFKQLESFTSNLLAWNSSWTNFVVKNGANLRMVEFWATNVSENLNDILPNLPKIEELKLSEPTRTTAVSIARILNTFPTIKRLEVNMATHDIPTIDVFNDKWNIDRKYRVITFHRKL